MLFLIGGLFVLILAGFIRIGNIVRELRYIKEILKTGMGVKVNKHSVLTGRIIYKKEPDLKT